MAGSVIPYISFQNPRGPLIRQGKLCVTRRLSNCIMARSGLYTFEAQESLEVFLICECLNGGIWELVERRYEHVEKTDRLETFYAFQCKPNMLHRVRAFYMVNNTAYKQCPTQRLLVEVRGIWNVWGRDDDKDEPRSIPMEGFYDDVPLPPLSDRLETLEMEVEPYQPYDPQKSDVEKDDLDDFLEGNT